MSIPLIDVTDWRKDDEHGIFPIGARDKKMLWSPSNPPSGIKPNWPYLFKLSRDAYPDQFWMETIAFLVGESLGVSVPKAYPAVRILDNETSEFGALLEWFYDKERQLFVHASEFFHVLINDFDDDSGQHHNIEDLRLICRAFSINGVLDPHPLWTETLCDMLLLDSLIGNTDRHQENWGFIFVPGSKGENATHKVKAIIAPFFDNGTSLGHERFANRVQSWTKKKLDEYIQNGCHHLRKSRKDTRIRLNHLSSIQNLAKDEAYATHMVKRLNFDLDVLTNQIRELCDIKVGEPFTKMRADWTIRLLERRHQRLSVILNMRTINKIIEPSRLLLTWQPTTGGTRHIVGQLNRLADDSYTFTYHFNTEDFIAAKDKGFLGHPAFSMKYAEHTNNVLEPFVRRLPPRKRKDFEEYLAQHLLPSPFEGSDFALLGYTGAKSPGDGFCLLIDPDVLNGEAELLLEVAGTRYQLGLDLERVSVGDMVSLIPEPDNEHDPNAIAVVHEIGKLGYINKVLCDSLCKRIAKNKVTASVAKKNGTTDRPLVYLILECEK
ncbi:HIRAN domain-containing protein [Yersinia mollaretii]|uniref:Uncharacterized protein related to capsule biosynthesis enzymes n=1 Tax=Yersinia mollaretii TaxID=33060 RepID=A0AA36LQD9_YERMO|nr:HIRAN domain-containing protein [Yersinia mollaretii]CNI67900.1 Uncharacterized protein related to capsule biosynthesis enzymes [Yersinia mollaretii]